MKKLIFITCIMACFSTACEAQINMNYLQNQINKAQQEHRRKKQQQYQREQQRETNKQINTQNNVNNLMQSRQYLEQSPQANADYYMSNPDNFMMDTQTQVPQLEHASKPTVSNKSASLQSPSSEIRTWQQASQQWNYGTPSGGNYIQEHHQWVESHSKKFEKPKSDKANQKKQLPQRTISSNEIKQRFAATNPQAKMKMDEKMRREMKPVYTNTTSNTRKSNSSSSKTGNKQKNDIRKKTTTNQDKKQKTTQNGTKPATVTQNKNSQPPKGNQETTQNSKKPAAETQNKNSQPQKGNQETTQSPNETNNKKTNTSTDNIGKGKIITIKNLCATTDFPKNLSPGELTHIAQHCVQNVFEIESVNIFKSPK